MVGNIANFTKIDLLRCLLRIEKPVSRAFLSKSLELGEGTIRSILDILKSKGYVESNNIGHYLSKTGIKFVEKIKDDITLKKIDDIALFPNKKIITLQIKNPAKTVNVVALRDEAVKNGAEGALILKFDKKLRFYDSNYKENLSEIESKLKVSKNDLVIVAYADSYKLAEYGAIAAAISINNPLADIINKLK
ncbi:MAG: DUF4443 domain-containing protein [Nanoarchaeota archaeon]